LRRLEELFYAKVLVDPGLRVLFPERKPHQVEHLTWLTVEYFGGPDRFTRTLGFWHIIGVHRRLNITEKQRERFVPLYTEAADETGLPADSPFAEGSARELR